jgi:hypothetical protein
MQENPVELVERVAGLMRIPALRHRRNRLAAPFRASRSSVLIALAFAIDWRPVRGRGRANRRSSSSVAGSMTGPELMGSKRVGWGRKLHRSL